MSIVLLGVPHDASSSYRRGAAGGPGAFREEWNRALEYSNLTTEAGLDLGVPERIRDAGDLPGGPAAEMRREVEGAVGDLLGTGDQPLLIGGDHAISYPALRAARAHFGPMDVIQFDAHPDLYPQFGGDPFSHASTFARALEDGLVSRLVQVGIRTANRPQREVAERYGVEQLAMANWTAGSAFFFERPLWVSVDLDVLDPAYAPGVSHPEPGGVSVRDVLGILHRLGGRVVGADLVEYNPEADSEHRTAAVCVKLIKELAGVLLQ